MNFGRAIKIVRAARGFSQKQLAKAADFDPSYISLIEKGERTPSTEAIQNISHSLNIPMSVLTLLASGKNDLRSISEDQAETAGKLLLGILLDVESSSINEA